VVQSMEVLNIFKNLGYKPKNTIRVVLLWMKKTDLEVKKYEELSLLNKENHIFCFREWFRRI
jgi:hypothetical protein